MLLTYGHIEVPADWKVEERTAPGFSRVYHVLSGDVIYTDEHCCVHLKVGNAYIFPSASPFSIHHDPAHPLVCTFLHLEVFPLLIRELIELPVTQGDFMEKLFATISHAIRFESPRVIAALSDAFLLYCEERAILTLPVLEISNLLIYIAEHIKQGAITVKELSRLMGYHPQYFIRLFHRSVGMTPHQYITNYRMSESIKLLKQKAYTVSQVADLVGYPDVKAFGRAFREKYGVSPSQFRKIDVPLP